MYQEEDMECSIPKWTVVICHSGFLNQESFKHEAFSLINCCAHCTRMLKTVKHSMISTVVWETETTVQCVRFGKVHFTSPDVVGT